MVEPSRKESAKQKGKMGGQPTEATSNQSRRKLKSALVRRAVRSAHFDPVRSSAPKPHLSRVEIKFCLELETWSFELCESRSPPQILAFSLHSGLFQPLRGGILIQDLKTITPSGSIGSCSPGFAWSNLRQNLACAKEIQTRSYLNLATCGYAGRCPAFSGGHQCPLVAS